MGNAASSISGNIGAYYQNQTQSVIAEANAEVAKAQGTAAKGQAYGQASKLEAENKLAGQVASENMSRLDEQKTQTDSSITAAHGSSGFSSEGSGGNANISALKQFEQAAQDMAYSRAIEDQSAQFNAQMMRKTGDISMMSAEAEYDYNMAQSQIYDTMSSNAKTAAITTTVTTAIGAAIGGFTGTGVMDGANLGSDFASAANSGNVGSLESQNGVSQNSINRIESQPSSWEQSMSSWLT